MQGALRQRRLAAKEDDLDDFIRHERSKHDDGDEVVKQTKGHMQACAAL